MHVEAGVQRPGAQPVCCNNFKTPVLVLGIVRFLEVHKYLVKYLLHHVCKLLYKLVLDVGGPRPMARPKSVKNVMELYHRGEKAVQNPLHCLPKDLYESNPPEVSAVSLVYQYHRLPGAIIGKCPVT